MLFLNQSFKRWWEFLYTMVERDLKSRYKNSVLGFLWIILNPIVQMIVIGLVFQFFTEEKTGEYLLYIYSGLIVWNFFSTSVLRGTSAIVRERFLLKKTLFPRETIVLAIVLSNFLQFLISIFILVLLSVLIGVSSLTILNFLLFPLSLFFLFFLCSGFTLFFSAINVKYRDTNFGVNFLVSLWFYLTPVIYSLEMLPEKVRLFFYINPLCGLIDFFRWSFLGTEMKNFGLVLVSFGVAFTVFLFGYRFFIKHSGGFDDWL